MREARLVSADARGRLTLTGRARETFAIEELSDGSVLLEPVTIDEAAQHTYDDDPALRALLSAAAASPVRARTVRQRRTPSAGATTPR